MACDDLEDKVWVYRGGDVTGGNGDATPRDVTSIGAWDAKAHRPNDNIWVQFGEDGAQQFKLRHVKSALADWMDDCDGFAGMDYCKACWVRAFARVLATLSLA